MFIHDIDCHSWDQRVINQHITNSNFIVSERTNDSVLFLLVVVVVGGGGVFCFVYFFFCRPSVLLFRCLRVCACVWCVCVCVCVCVCEGV